MLTRTSRRYCIVFGEMHRKRLSRHRHGLRGTESFNLGLLFTDERFPCDCVVALLMLLLLLLHRDLI
jgi:hypothetical protein